MLHAILRRHAPLKAKRNCLILACFFFIKKLFFLLLFIYLFVIHGFTISHLVLYYSHHKLSHCPYNLTRLELKPKVSLTSISTSTETY